MKTINIPYEEYLLLKNNEEIYEACKMGNVILVQDFRQDIGNYTIPQTEFKMISNDKNMIEIFFVKKAEKAMKESDELKIYNIKLQEQISKLKLKVFLLENNWFIKLCNKLKLK